MLKKSSILR